jgi:hypothetical protein
MKPFSFGEKLEFLDECMPALTPTSQFRFLLPVIWRLSPDDDSTQIPNSIGYTVHHLQYRSMDKLMPYLNFYLNRKMNSSVSPASNTAWGNDTNFLSKLGDKNPIMEQDPFVSKYKLDFTKPQYRFSTIFQVCADVQYDIYHLFACGKTKVPVYYNIAYIPNYKTSVFMNKVFRSIRENENLDYIEESDDEEDFQNIDHDKYVDLNKKCFVECIFNPKFKKWTPIRIADSRSKIVHISKLVRDFV